MREKRDTNQRREDPNQDRARQAFGLTAASAAKSAGSDVVVFRWFARLETHILGALLDTPSEALRWPPPPSLSGFVEQTPKVLQVQQ